MKSKFLLLLLCVVVVSTFALYQGQRAQASKNSSEIQVKIATPDLDLSKVQNIISKSDELEAKWLSSLGAGNWLYVSSKYETTEELGTDPETGLPLPNKSLWESWYTINSAGQQTAFLLRRTDLERGNMTYVAWQNDRLLRLPGGSLVDTSQQGNSWRAFRPLLDHPCSVRLQEFLSSSDSSIVKNISSELLQNASGVNQWVVMMTTHHPLVSDVAGFPGRKFTGEEFICYKDEETGAIESTEQFLITEQGERILLGHDYDYLVQWVAEPPTEMLDLLKRLDAAR